MPTSFLLITFFFLQSVTNFCYSLMFVFCSLREGVFGPPPRGAQRRAGSSGREPPVRHEGGAEGGHHPQTEDGRAHAHRAASARGDPGVALLSRAPLRVPDRRKAPPHSRCACFPPPPPPTCLISASSLLLSFSGHLEYNIPFGPFTNRIAESL